MTLTVDNGDLAGSHQLFGKNTMCEESIDVPLFISLPGQSLGRHVHAPVGHVDIVRTVLEELGIAPPDRLQDRSLAPWLDGADPPLRPGFLEWTGTNYLVHEDLKGRSVSRLTRPRRPRGRRGWPTPCAAWSRPRGGSFCLRPAC